MAFSKDKALERAEKYAAKGQHDRAAREYQSVVDFDPKDVRAWLMLADCLVRCGQRVEAADRYLQVATFYVEGKQPQKALAVYRQVLNLDASRLDVHIRVADLYRELGRIPDAVAAYELVAQSQFQSGQATEALKTYALVAECDPTAVSKRLRLAELYSREGMLDQAVDSFRIAAERLLLDGRTQDYIRVAERLIYHQKDDLPTLCQLARVYLESNEPRRALMKLNALLHANPSDLEGLELLAETFAALGKPDKAVSVMAELARELKNKGPDGRSAMFRVLRRGLEWDPHHSELRRALEEMGSPATAAPAPEPHAHEIHEAEGIDVEDDEEIEELELDDDDVVELDDDDVIMEEVEDETSLTATVLSEVGDVAEDDQVPDDLTDLDKILFEARVYVKYRLFEHSLDHLASALEQDPTHVGALGLKARAYTELGRGQEAADVHLQVARLVADRDPNLAREHAQAALERVPEYGPAMAVLADLESPIGERGPVSEFAAPENEMEVQTTLEVEDGDSDAIELVMDAGSADEVPLSEPEAVDSDEAEFSIELQEDPIEVEEDRTEPIMVENRFGLSEAGPLPDQAALELEAGPPSDPGGLELEADLPDPSEALEQAPSTEEAAPEPPARDWPDVSEDIAEVRFFLSQGLDEDAEMALDDLRAQYPGHPEIETLTRELGGAEPVSEPEPEGAAPVLLLDDEDEEADAYLSAIFSDEPQSAKKKTVQVQATASEVEGADAGTYFDLGIMYREMGLIDEALAQFEAAAADPRWKSKALVMMATMHVQRGETAEAMTKLESAIETAKTPDENCEARYELGLVYEEMGNGDQAIAMLDGVDPGYRDRDVRLTRLRANATGTN